MMVLKACAVCLTTDVKIYNMDVGHLRQNYNLVSGLRTHKGNGLPGYLCFECTAYLRRCKQFRDKCQRAHYALKQVLYNQKEITKNAIEVIDRKLIEILPSLSYVDNNRTHYEEVKFQWLKHNRGSTVKGEIPIVHHSTQGSIEIEVPSYNTNTNNVSVKVECEDTSIERDFNLDLPDLDDGLKDDSYEQPVTNGVEFTNETNVFQEFFVRSAQDMVEPQCKEESVLKKDDQEADGSNLDEEYASMVPITMDEARAAVEVYKMFSHGKHVCKVCLKAFFSENRLKAHMRMHDKYISGTFYCELCNYYYKTDFLLRTHMTEKHMYKYICRKCPEVSFDRTSAKQHFIWTHLQKGGKKNANWYESRPTWLHPGSTGGKTQRGSVSLRPVRKINKLPEDFPIYSPISHDEQYSLVKERQTSMNYLEAEYKCTLCYRGFRETATYNKHMRKHDPRFAGDHQCDVCKLFFRDTRKMYKHMNITHLFKYSCQMCSYVCYNKGQAHLHYRWHKNVTYQCQHCDKVFKKSSTRLTHIRIKHPSTYICNLCGHSFVSETGLYCHQRMAHSQEELEGNDCTEVNVNDPLYCADCNIQFKNQAAFATHFGSSKKHSSTNRSIHNNSQRSVQVKERKVSRNASVILNNGVPTSTQCEVCEKYLSNDVQARKHYEAEHPGVEYLKRYMCDVCGHTTKQYANLMVHMRTHTNEKPYECPHCDRRFSMPSNRDRHLVVHTGEKRYQCQLCSRRFTQSSAVKLHIQTVHLKIPYAPWDKKNRKRRREMEAASLPVMQPPVQEKVIVEPNTDYLNAYISYNDE